MTGEINTFFPIPPHSSDFHCVDLPNANDLQQKSPFIGSCCYSMCVTRPYANTVGES